MSGNVHKLQEFDAILDDVGCWLPLDELDVKGTVECGATYYQNAYRKARAGLLSISANEAVDCAVIADDSGLELPVFGRMPGVRSARLQYGGLSERAALAAFLTQRGVSSTPARFVCWIVAFVPWSPRGLAWSGTVTGTVTPKALGSHGFGYDALFTPDGYRLTFGEMDADVKNHISHRAQAVRVLWSSLQGALSLRP